MIPAACKCNDVVILLFQMRSPWHTETACWAAVMLPDKLPIPHTYLFFRAGSTLFQMYHLVALAVFPTPILFNTQSDWISGKFTDVQITTYVFSTKDPPVKKNRLLSTEKIHLHHNRRKMFRQKHCMLWTRTQDMLCNTAKKNITWCSALIWLWFRQDLTE